MLEDITVGITNTQAIPKIMIIEQEARIPEQQNEEMGMPTKEIQAKNLMVEELFCTTVFGERSIQAGGQVDQSD